MYFTLLVAPQLVVLSPNKCAAMAQLKCQLHMACKANRGLPFQQVYMVDVL